MKEIKICMGSSCFARGNGENLDYIEAFINGNNLDVEVEIVGLRCEDKCAKGPVVEIEGVEYTNCDLEKLKNILKERLLDE